MDYRFWLEKERRHRLKILDGSKEINITRVYRTCGTCNEVLLCHELKCPNCNSSGIVEEKIDNLATEVTSRMRCRYRFDHLSDIKR